MSINNTAFKDIMREYDEKRLRSAADLLARTDAIEAAVPAIADIRKQVAALSVSHATERIKGLATSESESEYKRKMDELANRRLIALAQAGYSAEDLLPHFDCPDCQDTGYIDGVMCSCLKNRITDALYSQSNIRNVLEKENFSTYTLKYYSDDPSKGVPVRTADGTITQTPRDRAVAACNQAKKFVREFSSGPNMLITGTPGVGKTFLTNCIAKELIDRGHFVIYLSAAKMFGTFSDAFADSRAEYTSQMNLINSCDLLIIDDLGTELTNSFVLVTLFNCLNERLLSGKSTIISTNLTLEEIRDRYSERISSRLIDKFTLIKLIGSDIRTVKKLRG